MMSGLPIIGSMEKFVGDCEPTDLESSLENEYDQHEVSAPLITLHSDSSSNGYEDDEEDRKILSETETSTESKTKAQGSRIELEEQPTTNTNSYTYHQQPPQPPASTSTSTFQKWMGEGITSDHSESVLRAPNLESDDDDDATRVKSQLQSEAAVETKAISKNSISCPPPNIISDGDEQAFIDRTLPNSPPSSSASTSASTTSPNKTSQRRQIIAALSANLGSMALGATLAWTSTALPDLRQREKHWNITANQESWIGSSMTLGAILGCPIAGYMMKFGRRTCTLLLILPFLLGWLSISFAQNLIMIYGGRALTGLGCGVLSLVVPIYIVETADPSIRGALTSGFDFFITVGILYIFLVGSYTAWRIQALLCGLIPVAFFMSMLFMPESPRFLVEKNRESEAVKAIAWLKDTQDSQQVKAELVEVKRCVDESKGIEGTWRDLFSLPVVKPTAICLALMFFQQLSGIDPVTFYTVDIVRSSGVKIDENLSVNIVGVAQVAATVTAALLVDRRGRRFLLLLSGIFMVLSLGTLGLFFYLKHVNHQIVPYDLEWLPLTSLLIYVIAFSIGFGPLPWLLLGELIPSHVIGPAACLVTMSRWTLGFICTLTFQNLIQIFGHDGAYWFFGSICLLGSIFVYFCVPETKNKTLYEIFLHFNPTLDPPLLPTA